MGSHALLHGIFSTQGSNLCLLWLLHCRRIIYHWATTQAQCNAIAYKLERLNFECKTNTAKCWQGCGDKNLHPLLLRIQNSVSSLENSSAVSYEVWYTLKVQFSSVTQSCLTLWDSMDCSMPGLPVHPQLLELTQTRVHQVSDTVQPSHPLSSPSPPTINLSQHQGLFQGVSSSHQVTNVLELELQHQSFQWIFRTDFL